METVTGKVKFFNEEKGFGFISQDGSDKDVFVHKTGTKEFLRENDTVEFIIEQGEKGPYATQVRKI
jgi:CspA family cold shock protein